MIKKFGIIKILASFLIFIITAQPVFSQTITRSEFVDKLEGGWLGQMAGVTWGAPTEIIWHGVIIPDNDVPVWQSSWINDGFGQDDIFVEIPFINAMKDYGVNCVWDKFGNYFRDSEFWLDHANLAGRQNLKNGIQVPWSGHYSYNAHCDDIDWQIDADFVGIICPGMLMQATDIAWRAGHVMNYGDGVYGGVVVAAMHSAAYFASSVNEIIEAGRQSVPVGTKYRQVIENVIAWKDQGLTWEQNWQQLENIWGHGDRCPNYINDSVNINATLNGAYIILGLLYGNGDFENSMRISMRCGQDSDCNPSSTGGILGNYLGFSNIPTKWKSSLNRTNKFLNTNYTYDDIINICINLAREIVIMSGGSISGSGSSEVWTIPDQLPPALLKEQWPANSNATPSLSAQIDNVNGNTVTFSATANGSDGIQSYQWFFGDLSFDTSGNANVSHTYTKDGTYTATCYVSDNVCNTSCKTVTVTINAGTTPAQMLADYQDNLDALRTEYAGSTATPNRSYFLFGMGNRTKLIYEDGVLKNAFTGATFNSWTVQSQTIVPNQYSVYITTSAGANVTIIEDNDAVWVTQNGSRAAVSGTSSTLFLPSFSEYKYGPVMRVLYQEILVNIVDGKPLPNYTVYNTPWYRDGAMIGMCLKKFGNLDLIRSWILGLNSPYDYNRGAGVKEADNLGQALYLISLVSNSSHSLVSQIQTELNASTKTDSGGKYIYGTCDGAPHPVYMTKWAKYGLRALGLTDPYYVPLISDGYSGLFWMDYKDRYVSGNDDYGSNLYPYLGWAQDHFHGAKNHCLISNKEYPLTWEGVPADSAESHPHTWHSAEALLYLAESPTPAAGKLTVSGASWCLFHRVAVLI